MRARRGAPGSRANTLANETRHRRRWRDEARLPCITPPVLCDSLTAQFRPDGTVIRAERGAVIGGARQMISRNGADTVSADPAGLDSLRAGLTDLSARGLAMDYRQGDPPCIPLMTTHTPVVTIEWAEGDGPHRVRYDFGCHEPSRRVEAVMLLALRVARFGERPVMPR